MSAVDIVKTKISGTARHRPAVVLVALLTLIGSLAWAVFVVPIYVSFACSVGLAISWCIWLERQVRSQLGNVVGVFHMHDPSF